ncbi:leucine-rich repeat protein [Vagococcus carniphilus]|uniref:Leucine-rich repeat domain-containing protein n=1 Tax=Vagococcus carniphilus TaxID=218144 RepID=A0A430ARX4_9ENTE|nr:leucine-rich repeat protein [Vagococcus carniphilus]MDT2813286.1 leucine-rich repeat protein [Vagococcus carniphilus]QNN73258.1 leucine-rich repeat protein [Vagococcus carniphilus]RSU10805.1 hypothetical protein CBF28_12965 [Vagococcus carniphilus]
MTEGSNQGLLVIVAIIIFGIFVAISYLLFQDKLHVGLSEIFEDGLEQASDTLNNTSNIKSEREDETYIYAKIREASPEKNETEIWVQAEKLKNGTLEIIKSSIKDADYSSGFKEMTGDLILPDKIDGKKITIIGYGAFRFSKFNGNLKLPVNLITVEEIAFYDSLFIGTLSLPNSLKGIDRHSFTKALFTGTFDLKNLNYIQAYAFLDTNFDRVVNDNIGISNDSNEERPTKGIHKKSIRMVNGSYYHGKK